MLDAVARGQAERLHSELLDAQTCVRGQASCKGTAHEQVSTPLHVSLTLAYLIIID